MNTPLKILRKKCHLSVKEIANYINCSEETYLNYENGKTDPPVYILKKLSFYYVTSIDYLLGITDTDKPYPRICQKEDKI